MSQYHVQLDEPVFARHVCVRVRTRAAAEEACYSLIADHLPIQLRNLFYTSFPCSKYLSSPQNKNTHLKQIAIHVKPLNVNFQIISQIYFYSK